MGKKNKYYLFVKDRPTSCLKNLTVKLWGSYSGARQNILDHIWFNDMGIRGGGGNVSLKNLLFLGQCVSKQ